MITLERWYSIKRALYANKLTIHRTTYFILVGYVYASVMGALPMFGISSYSTTSICLPMDTRNLGSKIYVHTLLLFSSLVFAMICVCYFQIYSSLDLSDTSITHLPTLGLDSIETLLLENTFTLKTIPSIYDSKLDLSDTSITHLPTLGLDSIETLLLENTFTLKTIPSIYDFKKLHTAHLTYSFHCCAFQFPEKHDPHKHAQYQSLMKQIAASCGGQDVQLPHSVVRREFGDIYDPANGSLFDSEVDTSTPVSVTEDYMNTPIIPAKLPHSVVRREFGDIYDPTNGSLFDSEVDTSTPVSVTEDYMNTPIIPAHRLQITCGNVNLKRHQVTCTPIPDALNPCEDIMGYAWLRLCVWFVISAAIV
ncbi:lutropin-choriogonadotropic hormone receptor-like, partial [Diaphorina citri]|uniref:Lutropin-choriogonadotropic hormone receptor-like n=1 Tax=Diaphorina citri TaxID=121845 RepID=A0A1S4EQE9_DIACI